MFDRFTVRLAIVICAIIIGPKMMKTAIRKIFLHGLSPLSTMEGFDNHVIAQTSKNLTLQYVQLMSSLRWTFILALVPYIFACAVIPFQYFFFWYFLWAFGFFFIARRRASSVVVNAVAIRIYTIVRHLERNSQKWNDASYRWNVARKIERLAKSVERISRGARSLSVATKDQVARMSRAKAAKIRELEILAIAASQSTRTDLVHILATNMVIIADGRWHELPESEVVTVQISKARKFLLASLGTLLVFGIIFLPHVHSLGSSTQPLTYFMGIAALVAFNSAGLSVAKIGEYAKVAIEAFKSGK